MHKPIVLIAEELSPATVDTLGSDVEILSCSGADRRLKVIGRAGAGLDNARAWGLERTG